MRLQKIDDFLKQVAKIYFQNPNTEICFDSFYSYLMHYGLNNKNIIDKDLHVFFDEWKDYFKDKENINVFHSERQRRFLQFHNKSEDSYKIDPIKMYVPFNKENINDNVKDLFDFTEENNIYHISKVSDIVRSDSVVLRVEDIDGANKVINYVSNNENMKSSMMEVNPFLTNINGIGIASDNNSSYNYIVANCLKLYFEDKRKKGFNNVSNEDFSNFIEDYYNKTFITCEKLDSLIFSEFFERENKDGYSNILVNNIRQIVRLLSENLKNENSIDAFSRHYIHCNNVNTNNNYEDFYYKNIENINNDCMTYSTYYNNEEEVKKIEKEDLLDSYMLYSNKKYSLEESNRIIGNYLLDNKELITDEYNFKNDFINKLNPDDIIKITENDDNKLRFENRFNKKIRNSSYGLKNEYLENIKKI